MNKLFFLSLLVLLTVPVIAFAQAFVPLTSVPAFTEVSSSNNIAAFLNNLYRISIGVAAVLAVLQITRAGISYSMGDSITEKKEARSLILKSVLGLVLVLSPAIVFGIIDPRILELNLGLSSLTKQGTGDGSGQPGGTGDAGGEGQDGGEGGTGEGGDGQDDSDLNPDCDPGYEPVTTSTGVECEPVDQPAGTQEFRWIAANPDDEGNQGVVVWAGYVRKMQTNGTFLSIYWDITYVPNGVSINEALAFCQKDKTHQGPGPASETKDGQACIIATPDGKNSEGIIQIPTPAQLFVPSDYIVTPQSLN